MFRFVLITTLLSPILFSYGANPATPPIYHPLMLALENGKDEMAELLIKFRCEIVITDEKLNTPMHAAMFSGNVKCVELLLEAQALKDELNELHHTPLITGLITKPGKPTIMALAKGGANLHHVCPNGLSALHWAVFNRDEDFVLYLVKEKVDVNAGHEKGYPPLAVALMTSADYLYVDSNSGETIMAKRFRVEGREENCNALILKLEEEEKKIKYFLSVRANNFDPRTALKYKEKDLYTMETGKFGIIPLLLNENANPDLVYKRGDFEISPLNLAAYYKNNEAVRRLLARGARVEVTTFNGYSPFLIAVRKSYLNPGTIYRNGVELSILKKETTFDEKAAILSLLLKKNAQVNQANDLNETAVLWAVAMEDKDLLNFLKKHGAIMDLPKTSNEDQRKISARNE